MPGARGRYEPHLNGDKILPEGVIGVRMELSVSSLSKSPGLNIRNELIEEELRAILASPPFHTSRRCSDFLQFIVQRTLEGRSGELKERTIATEVFGRDVLYEPKLDALVRVRANDLRKRLAQYYQAAGPAAKVRFDLPLGSYVPTMEPIQSLPAPTPPLPKIKGRIPPSRRTLVVLAAVCVSLLTAAAWWRAVNHHPSDLEEFWGLLLPNSKPVAVCVMPSPSFDFPGGNVSGKIVRRNRRRYEVQLDPSFNFGQKLIYEVDAMLWVGDARAAMAVSHVLGELRKPVDIKDGEEVSFADMKDAPAVLVGAYNNRWAVEVNAGLPVSFGPNAGIQDSLTGHVYRMRQDDGKVIEDFGLVSRLVTSKTGGPLVTLGGIKHYATQAAAELVTNPEFLRNLIEKLPAGWRNRNLQIIFRTVLVQERAGPPQIIAVHVW